MNNFCIGDKVKYIGTDPDLWYLIGIIRYVYPYNSIYNYTAYIIDFENKYGIIIPDTVLISIKSLT